MSLRDCRHLACVLAMMAAAPVLFADDKSEWKTLNGSWTVEKAVFMGNDSTETFKSAVLTMKDGSYTVTISGQKDKGTLKLDSKAKPKRVTILSTEGPNKGQKIEGIYAVDGNTLKVCYSFNGTEAPKAFESKEGTATLYIVYKRKADKK